MEVFQTNSYTVSIIMMYINMKQKLLYSSQMKRKLKSQCIQKYPGVGVRIPIRVWFGSIRVSGFRCQRFQSHLDISKFQFGFGPDRIRITHLNDF